MHACLVLEDNYRDIKIISFILMNSLSSLLAETATTWSYLWIVELVVSLYIRLTGIVRDIILDGSGSGIREKKSKYSFSSCLA